MIGCERWGKQFVPNVVKTRGFLSRVGGKAVVCRLELLELGTSLGPGTGVQLVGDATRQRQLWRKEARGLQAGGDFSLPRRLLLQGQQNGPPALLWA